MKTLKQTVFFSLIILAFAISSCSKDDDGGGGGQASKGQIQAKVQGIGDFSSDKSITFANRVQAGPVNLITINGTNLKQQNIGFTIQGVTETGTYAIGGGANISISASYIDVSTQDTWQAPYDDTEVGQLKITSISDTNIQGTFSFSGKNGKGGQSIKEVSSGSFNVDFQ